MRSCPHLYEINAYLLVKRMSRRYGRTLTLATVPDEEWRQLASLGFDLVWLMGVWKRSPGSRQKALTDPVLGRAYDQALPGWTNDDVAGSPYAIYSYSLDPSLGKSGELAQLKQKLNQHGLGLMVDFVPNHLAFDHPWTLSHPDWFVQGRKADVRAHPDGFFSSDRSVYLAHGRDPNYPPWTDTVQVNFWSHGLRSALIEALLRIAEVADGVRCDMAMLALNDVFGQVWGDIVKAHPRPETEFWTEAIGRVKEQHPDFLFLAEVYWGLERTLQRLGFDFTYDKPLYNRLRFSPANDIRNYLMMNESYQQRSVHFIENHDEERAVTAFGRQRSLAAAAIIATVPGLRLFHDGQLEGKRIHLPIQLVHEPEEEPDTGILEFYKRLLAICNGPAFHEGKWRLVEVSHAENNTTHDSLLAWLWHHSDQTKLVVVNYSSGQAEGWLRLLIPSKTVGRVALCDELTGATHIGDYKTLGTQGIYLDIPPWNVRIFDMGCGLSALSRL